VTCVKPQAALYMFPRLDPKVYPIKDDQQFFLELLQETKVMLVQGTGFNWPARPFPHRLPAARRRPARGHWPHREVLENYRKRHILMKAIQVGLLGIGTVGSGTFNVLNRNQEEIRRRAGRGIEITMVADLDTARAQAWWATRSRWSTTPAPSSPTRTSTSSIELIGGYGIAKALVLEAIEAGKHVVTANKALLAVHGTEIFAAAHRQGRDGGFRSGRGRRHPHHQGAARGPDRQQHPVDRRHHQRHHQLHPVRDARQGPGL
jgi:hypothetical protein